MTGFLEQRPPGFRRASRAIWDISDRSAPLLGAKNSCHPLETFLLVADFFGRHRHGGRGAFGAPNSRRAPEGVRCQLVPNLLIGGFGYEV